MATTNPTTPRNRLRPLIWGVATALLLVPAIAMRFTRDVDWTALDFAVMGVLLYGTCGVYEVATRMSPDRWYRAGAGVAAMTGFLLVWVDLAVGIIDSERDVANLVFAGVLMVGAIGAAIARFRARGMAVALLATAAAQMAAAMYAMVAGHDGKGVYAAGMFVPMWLASAWLFHRAARGARPESPVRA
ncbi:hypothetical protein [Lysobacter claricitrinus]|uniref:hypothetical protein n=1 Tax=Lysobacter claricitrinus TaxID=3367728 RepID=UPI0037DAA324